MSTIKRRKERESRVRDIGDSGGKLGQVWVTVFSRPHWSGDIWAKMWSWWGGGCAGIWWRMSQCKGPKVGAGLACLRNSSVAQAERVWARIREAEDRSHGVNFPRVVRIKWRDVCKVPSDFPFSQWHCHSPSHQDPNFSETLMHAFSLPPLSITCYVL